MIEKVDGGWRGSQSGDGITTPIDQIIYDNGTITWINQITKPMKMKLEFTGVVAGDTITGKVKAGFMGKFPFTAKRD